jgi:alpha-D-ribose 1-methylphosphonate 5-triphosphate synthase subunit PhnL
MHCNIIQHRSPGHHGHDLDVRELSPPRRQALFQLRPGQSVVVSQFLRVIPRVATLDVVTEPAIANGMAVDLAQAAAKTLLERLRIPERLWSLAPATFSGGEQQRVNIARGFIVDYPIMLLDEPTASLDAQNRATVIELINEAKAKGSAIAGIFHDAEVRDAVADRLFEVAPTTLQAA